MRPTLKKNSALTVLLGLSLIKKSESAWSSTSSSVDIDIDHFNSPHINKSQNSSCFIRAVSIQIRDQQEGCFVDRKNKNKTSTNKKNRLARRQKQNDFTITNEDWRIKGTIK